MESNGFCFRDYSLRDEDLIPPERTQVRIAGPLMAARGLDCGCQIPMLSLYHVVCATGRALCEAHLQAGAVMGEV